MVSRISVGRSSSPLSFPRARLVTGAITLGLAWLLAACSTGDPEAEETPKPGASVPAGTKCKSDATCGEGNKCVDGGCIAESATDGKKNGDETDVDCGGSPANPRCGEGKKCNDGPDCESAICKEGVCTAPTATDGLKNQGETDIDCGGPNAPVCANGKECKAGTDCESKVCKDDKCAEPTATDGQKNGTETDVDCGGDAAPPCGEGKACALPADCDSRFCTTNVCEPRKPGRQDGDETDVDCGGTVAPKCDWEKGCLVDADCMSAACGGDKKCLVGPSCAVDFGGTTCGLGEVTDGFKQHESCCRTLPVANYTDPRPQFAGKTVYLDKYEITAGRMRKFIDTIAAANGGVPNIKGYMAAHRPARWNNGWENTLPSGFVGSIANFSTQNPTVDLLYPGQDQYLANSPTQSSWSVASGNWQIDIGINNALGAPHFFPEYVTTGSWPEPDYAASHNLNCFNGQGSYGYSTYWFPNTKYFSQNDMDQKALNCTPFGMYAAFCAWDGGQIATEEVIDYVTNGRIGDALTNCGGNNTLNTFSDGGGSCPAVYYYPNDMGNTFDGSSRIAPPGRVSADVVRINANDEPWMDLKGNLLEVVLRSDTTRFNYRSGGASWGSVTHHRNQITTPRMKGGAFGARCMRFK